MSAGTSASNRSSGSAPGEVSRSNSVRHIPDTSALYFVVSSFA
jgi:hypothetical protein